MAERRGKGGTPTIACKHFGTPGCFETDYIPQKPEVEAPLQKTDIQKTLSHSTQNSTGLLPVRTQIPAVQSQLWIKLLSLKAGWEINYS